MARYRIKRKGDSLLRDGLILLGITLVLGLILVLVFRMTKSSIDEGAKAARDEAYMKAFDGYDVRPYEDESVRKLIEKYNSGPLESDNASYHTMITDGAVMKDANGGIAGYAYIASSEGYNGAVTISVGITTEGVITGIDIVSMNETSGIGANCTEPEFKEQFKGLSGEVNINGKGNQSDNGIDAITGATVTTEAVTRAVNACLNVTIHSSLRP